jgi:hypothetical protein
MPIQLGGAFGLIDREEEVINSEHQLQFVDGIIGHT